ncbi:MAG: hypothetical protein U9Q92_05510 [archaeon]|nr:hypothetical protein [archaeon]
MEINYIGSLEPAIILLSDSKDRRDYLNSFLKYASEIFGPANIHFNGAMDIPQGILQEPYASYMGPFVDIRAGDGNHDDFIISVEHLEEVDKKPETLEKIIATFAKTEEKLVFKEVSKEELSEQDDIEPNPPYDTYMVTEISGDKVSFIPVKNYRQQTEINISKSDNPSQIAKGYPVAEYHLNWQNKRIVDVYINGGKNPFNIKKAYRLAKKLKPEMPGAKIYCSGFGRDKLVNDGYDWNMGDPIIWTSETRARRERLDIESKDARESIVAYLKAHGYKIKNGAVKEDAFKYARDFAEMGITDPEVVAGASILKGIESAISASMIRMPLTLLGGIEGAVANVRHTQDRAGDKKIEELIDFFSHGDTEKYMQDLSEALNRYIGDFSR